MSPSQRVEDEDDLEINDATTKRQSSLLLDTIDRFQGSDRDIIIFGLTHTKFGNKKMDGILSDWRRINVALTRAKCKLILIASISSLKKSSSNTLKNIVDITNKQNWIYQIHSY